MVMIRKVIGRAPPSHLRTSALSAHGPVPGPAADGERRHTRWHSTCKQHTAYRTRSVLEGSLTARWQTANPEPSELSALWPYTRPTSIVGSMQMPNGFPSQPHPERRRSVDRRLGDRRRRVVPVAQDRRRSSRRRAIERREGAAGHVRNALQVLTAVVSGEVTGPDVPIALNGAINRLWRALPEIDRLHDRCHYLGDRLRDLNVDSDGH